MITFEIFGKSPDGQDVKLYRLANPDGSYIAVMDYGVTIQAIVVPGKDGVLRDVVMGFDSMEGYLKDGTFQGATCGRVANRIGNAEFEINGARYEVLKNAGPNHLHGGKRGFDKYVWDSKIDGDSVVFSRRSPDGEEGYPGTLDTSIRYRFGADHKLIMDYYAVTDKDTLCNLTNHSYFNLDGMPGENIHGHIVTINADRVTEGDADCLTTGKFIDVEGTVFDFRKPRAIGDGIHSDIEQIKLAGGYDHNFCVNGEGFRQMAVAYSPKSGITMETWCDLPGVQMYTTNGRRERVEGKRGMIHGEHSGVCFETQFYPNAAGHAHFPSIVLRAGDEYKTRTMYWFR